MNPAQSIHANPPDANLPQHRETEKEWKNRIMKNFNPQDSAPWKFLQEWWSDQISREEIVSLGQVCAHELGPLKLPLEYRRRKETMIKWFDEHWDVIRPFLENNVEILETEEDVQKYTKLAN
jgi:hypothetical protein